MGLLGKKKVVRRFSFSSSSDEAEESPKCDLVPYDCAHFVKLVRNVSTLLPLPKPSVEPLSRFASFFYHAMAIELRDMFRFLRGLSDRGSKGTLKAADVTTFYEWFEGFFGILTTIFDTQEDAIFSEVERNGGYSVQQPDDRNNSNGTGIETDIADDNGKTNDIGGNSSNHDYLVYKAFGLSRRKIKEQRARDICWDIFDIKMKYDQRGATDNETIKYLVEEIACEAELLSARVLMYFQTCRCELPPYLHSALTRDERTTIEEQLIQSLTASQPGKFVLSAIARGIPRTTKSSSILTQKTSFKRGTVDTGLQQALLKRTRKFGKLHADLVDKFAVDDLLLEGSSMSYSTVDGKLVASLSSSSSSSSQ